MVTRCAFWFPLAICTWLALVPEPPEHPVFRLSDVFLHALAFTYLTFALVLAGYGSAVRGRIPYLRSFLIMMAYGLFLELAQSLVPERTPELKDLLVDMVGTVAGLVLAAVAVGPLHGLIERSAARL